MLTRGDEGFALLFHFGQSSFKSHLSRSGANSVINVFLLCSLQYSPRRHFSLLVFCSAKPRPGRFEAEDRSERLCAGMHLGSRSCACMVWAPAASLVLSWIEQKKSLNPSPETKSLVMTQTFWSRKCQGACMGLGVFFSRFNGGFLRFLQLWFHWSLEPV